MKNDPSPKSRAGRKKGFFGIDDAEWDFSEKNIPSKSVHECLMYEYARELIRRSPAASSALGKLQQADCSGDHDLFFDSLQEMNSFLKTKSSRSACVYPYMDEVPWIGFQRQLEKEKQELIKRRKPVRQRPSLGRGKKGAPTEILKSDTEASDELLYWGKGLTLLKNPPYEPGKLYEKFNQSVRAANVFLDMDVRRESCGFFAVDLRARVSDVLADFEAWLGKERIKAGIVDAERRGRTGETDKAFTSLKALGAYRLMTMTKMSAAGIVDAFQHRLKRPALYSNAPEWSRAKKTVMATLRDIFIIPADAIF